LRPGIHAVVAKIAAPFTSGSVVEIFAPPLSYPCNLSRICLAFKTCWRISPSDAGRK
jgi:hypothetical protein